MAIPSPQSLPSNSCPPSILIRAIAAPTITSSSPPRDANPTATKPLLLEFSPPLTTIPLHLWTKLSWVSSPISTLLGTPIQLARYPAAAATPTTTVTPSTISSTTSAPENSPASSTEEYGRLSQEKEEEDADADFKMIAPLLPFFLEVDPHDVEKFGKVRLNWLQGTVIVSSAAGFSSTTTTAAAGTPPADPAAVAAAGFPDPQAQKPNSIAGVEQGCNPEENLQQHLDPRRLAQMVQYLNGPVFRAIKSYRKLDLLSVERKVRARVIREELLCAEAFERWVLCGGADGEAEVGWE
ncbi:hypothetical protein KC340_g3218 [Hortaea werneckii]|nr:hypothetical protein KC342_g12326 [Hortaea werneckii]KAI7099035.1 hypothetical protein KC339_g8511 [Hortaea werneckii]KAI7225690.1 hypothetical protein KC365_g9833 [Hortaea werneckii]KAI7332824.1 hypothetical protein KC340_g3218 [Hortaea werneckii]KAI7390322.1 hypothetical protein KC328_g8002 [Hortaea werneckii]